MTTAMPERPALTTQLKLLYSTGDLSTSMPQAVLLFYQLYFLLDVAGLRPDYAAWAIAAGRVWDAINDPLFGVLADRINSPMGRRRVLLLFGAVPLGLLFAGMWLVPPVGQFGLAVYYALIFICFDTAYTAVHVGYNSLTPELTQDYDERSALNGYRMMFSIGGSLSAIITATVLDGFIDDQRILFMVLGVSLGLFFILPPLLVFSVTKDYRSANVTDPIDIREGLRATLSNFPFQMVMGLYLLSWTTVSILTSVLIFFANYYLGVPEQANYFVLTAQVSGLAFVPVSVWLARKYDKRIAFLIGMGSLAVFGAGFFFVPPGGAMMTYIFCALAGLGIATSYVIPWAMIPDIIEDDEQTTGQRREASFYAFIAFFQKLGTGLALWLMGQAFALTGYITPTEGMPLPTQPDGTVLAIRVFISLLPAVLLAGSMVFAWKYPISREYHRKLVDDLVTRDG